MADVQPAAGPVRRPGFLSPEQIEALVRERFGAAAGTFEARAEDSTLWIDRGKLVEVMRFLKDDPRLSFDFLMALTGMDWKDKLGVVYHLFSYPFRHRFGVKVSCPYDDPHIASVERLWKTAEWQEREAFDLFGIVFDGHPDLRRVLMPEDWIGHPMRKDYQEPPDYRGIPTTRPNPLVILEEFNRREQERVNEKRKAEAPADAAPAAGHGHAPKPAEGE